MCILKINVITVIWAFFMTLKFYYYETLQNYFEEFDYKYNAKLRTIVKGTKRVNFNRNLPG